MIIRSRFFFSKPKCHFPTIEVEYPSDCNIFANVGVDSATPAAFLWPGRIPLIPVLPGYLPVLIMLL